MKKIKVLIFPSGTEIGLEVNRALKFIKDIEVFGVSTVSNHSEYVFENYIEGLDPVSSESFIDDLNEIIDNNKIDIVFPASDDVSEYLSIHSDLIHCKSVISPKETSIICRDKELTYSYFRDEFFCPKVINLDEAINVEFPVFLKPKRGAGAVGARVINNMEELILFNDDNQILTEYLVGDEFTVDCFTDHKHNLKFIGMRERARVKNGISVRSISEDVPKAVSDIAEIINSKLDFNGSWFFQVKKDDLGNFKLLEVSTRIAGTSCVYRAKGVNLPLLSIYNELGMNTNIQENKFNVEVDRALENKFKIDYKFETIFIDFDDTVTIGDRLNPYVVFFLYQQLNLKKEIILITRHKHDIYKTLKDLKLDESLFDKIIHLDRKDKKSDHIQGYESPIFIDDSFGERQDVIETIGCPVFDIASIEALIK